MSQYNASGHKGYKTANALAKGIIVKLSSGNVVAAAAATDKFIGVTAAPASASSVADVRLRSAQGTLKVIAGDIIAVGDYVTSDSAGKAVATTTTGNQILGMAVEAAAAGDLFEVIPAMDRY